MHVEYCATTLRLPEKYLLNSLTLFVLLTGKLDANRPVPFRLTPNLAEFLTPVGVNGVVSAAIVSAARCLAEPHFSIQSILRAVLRDEMIAWHKKVSFHGDRSSLKY